MRFWFGCSFRPSLDLLHDRLLVPDLYLSTVRRFRLGVHHVCSRLLETRGLRSRPAQPTMRAGGCRASRWRWHVKPAGAAPFGNGRASTLGEHCAEAVRNAMPGTALYSLALVGAISAPLAMVAIGRTTAAPPPVASVESNRATRADQLPTFQRRWEPFADSTAVPLNAVRHDRSREAAAVAGTEPVRPPPMSTPRHLVREQADVCARHGMRKVTTRGGRSWRCRLLASTSTARATAVRPREPDATARYRQDALTAPASVSRAGASGRQPGPRSVRPPSRAGWPYSA
jgi:hypothetical protein